VLGQARNTRQSYQLQDMIPLDREDVLDLGTGGGHWAGRIAQLYPWMNVIGIDYGYLFVRRAQTFFDSRRVHFHVADFAALPYATGAFDCIYADNTLEHAYDVDRTLAECWRVLRMNGLLLAAIPSDGRNPKRICDNHVWKTVPHEVRMRLQQAGFVDIEIDEIDTLRSFDMSPYPPANDRMMYVRAWKRPKPISKLQRALDVMDWVYRRLSPDRKSYSMDAVEILADGYAWCAGYARVLGVLLRREGFDVHYVTMLARDHLKGRGEHKEDTHEVIEATIDGKQVILDPTANTCIPYSLEELTASPHLAVEKADPDERYLAQGYHLYDTSYWYERIYKYAYRSELPGPLNWQVRP
jgi:SAM-dependent methyltransferase